MRTQNELLKQYEDRLLDELNQYEISATVLPYGIFINCGFDRWLIDVRGNITLTGDKAHVILYHQNLINKAIKCNHKKKGWCTLPDIHI